MARIATTAFLLVLTLLQAGAQSRAEQKKIEAMQLEAAIKNLVYSGSYRFYANSATPVSSHFGKAMGLDPYSYGMTITPEKIESYLPFYGTSSSIQYGSTDSPLTYTSTHFTYEIADPSTYKQKMIRVIIEAHPDKNQSNTVKNVLDIYFNGTAELWVDYLGQSGMKFRGVVNEDKPRK